jgi:hypothetical protein
MADRRSAGYPARRVSGTSSRRRRLPPRIPGGRIRPFFPRPSGRSTRKSRSSCLARKLSDWRGLRSWIAANQPGASSAAWISAGERPAAYSPPISAPHSDPTTRSTSMCCSSSACSTPMCASPRTPPPERTSAIRGAEISAGGASCARASAQRPSVHVTSQASGRMRCTMVHAARLASAGTRAPTRVPQKENATPRIGPYMERS